MQRQQLSESNCEYTVYEKQQIETQMVIDRAEEEISVVKQVAAANTTLQRSVAKRNTLTDERKNHWREDARLVLLWPTAKMNWKRLGARLK